MAGLDSQSIGNFVIGSSTIGTTRSTDDYLGLIEPQHQTAPDFVATVALTVDVLTRLQAFLATIPQAFDIDYAIGVQLDAVGVRVGISRDVPYPLQGLFFSFEDARRGYDIGVWKGPYDTGFGIYRLNDDDYRRLLYAKVGANVWNGTIDQAKAILAIYFDNPSTNVFIEDEGAAFLPDLWFSFDDPLRGYDLGSWESDPIEASDMNWTIGVSGKIPSLVDLAIMDLGLVGVKPAGVNVSYSVVTVDNSPLFGFDLVNQFVAGYDIGVFGASPSYVSTFVV